MKKIYSLIFGLMLTMTLIGQEVVYTDISKANEAKLNGVFHFSFDNHFTLENLTKASKFYTDHFSVVYTKSTAGYDAKITILTNDQLSRKVLERYFATLGVQSITFGDSQLQTHPFLIKFVMLPTQ